MQLCYFSIGSYYESGIHEGDRGVCLRIAHSNELVYVLERDVQKHWVDVLCSQFHVRSRSEERRVGKEC